MRTQITITHKDIREGEGNSGLSCAVALAVRRKFKTDHVYVQCENQSVNISVEDQEFKTDDPAVEEFIDRFDAGQDVEPFSFQINKLINKEGK